ncbi:hypothetical protein ACS0TY_014837 [Phlomoides rotata]
MKGDKMAKRSSFGMIMRKRLSDITNSLPQPKSPEKLPPDNVSAKDYIDHLLKEKMALMKHIQDKNKIIEVSGIEIQKLRTCLQKMQLQNWTLAQTNSQILGELNMGKERLKALQHEIACKEVLLKTKNLQLKEKEEMNVQKTQFQEAVVETNIEDTRRRRLSRSRSLGSSTMSQQQTEKEAAAGKRRCMRRQSASSRSRHDDPTDNLFEIDEAKFPEDDNSVVELEREGRRSVSRPLRRAAEKVQSYKERPINIKMRRPE